MDYSLDKKLQGFKQIAQEKLQAILCSIPSPKDLIIEPSLIKPLEHVCVASWVKSKGVQKIYKFDQKHAVPKQQNTQVFFINANLLTFKFVLDQIHEHENNEITQLSSSVSSILSSSSATTSGIAKYHIIIFPNVYNSFHTLLEEEGLYGIVNLHRYNWDFIHLDDGLMSLEMPQVFGEIFMHKDFSIQSSIIHSFRILNMIIGKPDIILCFGDNSEKILEMYERLEYAKKTINNSNKQQHQQHQSYSDFSAMIIIDRNKDYPSALLTPAIYSGLLLEIFKYRAGELEISQPNKISSGKLQIFKTPLPSSTSSASCTSSSTSLSSTSSSTVLRMNSIYDEIYGENRYKHFSDASNLVRAQAKSIGYEVKNLNKMKINEMHEYIAKKLPKITDMKNKIIKHLNVCEQIINELAKNFQKQLSLEEDILNNINRKQILQKIDEILIIDGHKYNIIRLICLAHISINLTTNELTNFIRNYCNIFGHKYLYIFQSLSKAGLLPIIDNNNDITNNITTTIGNTITKNKLVAQAISTTTKLTIPTKFQQQTEFQANANRLKLLTSYIDKPQQQQQQQQQQQHQQSSTIINNENDNNNSSTSIDDRLCPSYVFNGLYIPLIAQLASILLKSENFDEINTKLGSIDKMKLYLTGDFSSYNDAIKNIKQLQQLIKKGELMDHFPIKRRSLLIFVVGGVTYAEISACDLIAKLTNSKIVITSNCICSGSDLISAAF